MNKHFETTHARNDEFTRVIEVKNKEITTNVHPNILFIIK